MAIPFRPPPCRAPLFRRAAHALTPPVSAGAHRGLCGRHQLLVRDPRRRLGTGGDSAPLKAHRWFAALDLDALERKEVAVPFKPIISESGDAINFDDRFTKKAPMDSPIQTPQDASAFSNFTFVKEAWFPKCAPRPHGAPLRQAARAALAPCAVVSAAPALPLDLLVHQRRHLADSRSRRRSQPRGGGPRRCRSGPRRQARRGTQGV